MPHPARTTKNPSSFPKFILLVVLLFTLAALGVWAYNATKKSNSTTGSTIPTNSTQTPATSPTQTPTDTRVFKIPELGIQMTLPEGLEGLEYKVDKNSSTGDIYAIFNTKDLKQADQNCVKYGSIGTFMRYSKDPTDRSSSNLKKIGVNYYEYIHPQQSCTTSDVVDELQTKQSALLSEAFDTIAIITN